jgi:hypothetical protein
MSVVDGGGISQAQAIVLARIADDEAAVAASDFWSAGGVFWRV